MLPTTGANLECPECVTAFPKTVAGLHGLVACLCRHHRETLRAAGIHPVYDVNTQPTRDRTYHVAAIVGARSLMHQARIRSALELLHDPLPEQILQPSISKDYVSIFPEDDEIPSADAVVDTDVHADTPSSATITPITTLVTTITYEQNNSDTNSSVNLRLRSTYVPTIAGSSEVSACERFLP